jgi:hypothetical protein
MLRIFRSTVVRSGRSALIALGVATCASQAFATVSLTGPTPTYSQNFDSLSGTGWTNNSTLAGWELFAQPAPGSAISSIVTGTGSSNAGGFYSFGTSAERAFGGVGSGGTYFNSPGSGAVAGWMTLGLSNGTGLTIDSFTVGFDGEQWRNGGNTSTQTMVMEYGFGASFSSVGSWTAPGAAFNFVSPTVGSTGAALDGNAAANRSTGRGGSVSSLTWAPGSTLWVRWIENNDAGNDHGLAIDNFAFSAHTVPEPATLALLALGGVSFLRRGR